MGKKSSDDSSLKFYKSSIAGLSVSLGTSDPEDRTTVGVDEVKFKPVSFFDEKRGEHYQLGFLATADSYVQEVLDEDPNVVEIKQAEYDEAVQPAKTEAKETE